MGFDFANAVIIGENDIRDFERKILSETREIQKSFIKSNIESAEWMINLIELYQREGKININIEELSRSHLDSYPWDTEFFKVFCSFISHVKHEQKKSAFFGKSVKGN